MLPAEWGSTAASNGLGAFLQELYLHQTQLSGEIPTSWLTGFPNVTRFTVWGTNMCGLHPQNGTGLGALCLDTTRTRLGEQVANSSPMQQDSVDKHAVSSLLQLSCFWAVLAAQQGWHHTACFLARGVCQTVYLNT